MRIVEGKCIFCSKQGVFSSAAYRKEGRIPFFLCDEHKQLADILRYCIENRVSQHLLFTYLIQYENDKQFFLNNPTPDHKIMLHDLEKDFPKLEVFKLFIEMEQVGIIN